jgi:membrane associated rhomboid family serine protease
MTPMVAGLIAINVIVYILESLHRVNVITRFALLPVAVHDQHQWYRLITAAFLHANVTHIAFNMITLAIVGPAVEATIGHVRFAVLYLLAALGGSVASYLLSSPVIYGVGASGAIFGVMGAYFVLARRHGWELTTISALIIINLLLSFTSGIDWRAHLGGLVTGGLVALGMQAAADRRGHTAWVGAVVTAAVVLAVLAGLAQIPPGHVNLS